MIMLLRYVSSLGAPYALTRKHPGRLGTAENWVHLMDRSTQIICFCATAAGWLPDPRQDEKVGCLVLVNCLWAPSVCVSLG
jgi:hypothetical protein